MCILRISLVILLCSSGVAQASKLAMVYDGHRDIAWLGVGGYAKTSGYVTSVGGDVSETDGRMTYLEAVKWKDQFTVSGFENWRLKAVDKSYGSGRCAGLNCNGSKLTAFYAWLFHPGNLTDVPVPSSVWLIGSALIMLIGFRCRRDD